MDPILYWPGVTLVGDISDATKLAHAIAEAAQKAGIYNNEVPLTGPHLLMLLDEMATTIASKAPGQ